MTYVVITLALLAFAGSSTAVWALLGRSKLTVEAETAKTARDDALSAVESLETERRELDERATALEVEAAELRTRLEGIEREHEQNIAHAEAIFAQRMSSVEEKERVLKEELGSMRERSEKSFEALAAKTLRSSTDEFLKLAKQSLETTTKTSKAELDDRRKRIEELVKPVSETLTKLEERIQLDGAARQELTSETAKLVKALSRPEIRGRYGEIQLRRVAELAGMTGYCDFEEQASVRDDAGELHKPDMIVKLPAGRVIAVDAKTNVQAYIDAVNATDDAEREKFLTQFARHVETQVTQLSSKKYWALFEQSPEFVVMFVPGDHFIDAALQRKPDLIEKAANQNIILASPSTLIGLLRAVAVGWHEQTLAEKASELRSLGRELHERAATAFGHAEDLGKSIKQTVERYNKLVGSIDSRLTPTLKRFEEAGVKSAKELPDAQQVIVTPKALESATSEA